MALNTPTTLKGMLFTRIHLSMGSNVPNKLVTGLPKYANLGYDIYILLTNKSSGFHWPVPYNMIVSPYAGHRSCPVQVARNNLGGCPDAGRNITDGAAFLFYSKASSAVRLVVPSFWLPYVCTNGDNNENICAQTLKLFFGHDLSVPDTTTINYSTYADDVPRIVSEERILFLRCA